MLVTPTYKNMAKSNLTVHMVVKNEDQWVWYAIKSIIPFVHQILITDTGSTDKTVELVKTFNSPKIIFSQKPISKPEELTAIRQEQLEKTTTPWIWLVDGDEIYPESTAKEIVSAVKSNQYEGIVVRRYDLLGDIYHRQIESVGEYQLFGERGHLVSRLFNKDLIKGLNVKGAYPNEGYFDGSGVTTRARDPNNWYITKSYLYHAMYLKRSSLGGKLPSVFNRSKYKIEQGIKITTPPPEVFSNPYPLNLNNPLQPRRLPYQAISTIITPIKKLKRKLIK